MAGFSWEARYRRILLDRPVRTSRTSRTCWSYGVRRAALDSDAGYVGLMGSRRHTPGVVAELRASGADLRGLHSPTGLDIGARVPAEIALSILAEVFAATRGRDGGSLDIVRATAGADAAGAPPA